MMAAMRAVIQATTGPLTVRELFVRTMRIVGEGGDPDKVARLCGLEPDDLVYVGENFEPAIKLVGPN
jgi:hypothetical protein